MRAESIISVGGPRWFYDGDRVAGPYTGNGLTTTAISERLSSGSAIIEYEPAVGTALELKLRSISAHHLPGAPRLMPPLARRTPPTTELPTSIATPNGITPRSVGLIFC